MNITQYSKKSVYAHAGNNFEREKNVNMTHIKCSNEYKKKFQIRFIVMYNIHLGRKKRKK